jgi:cell division GTPase FtsZ
MGATSISEDENTKEQLIDDLLQETQKDDMDAAKLALLKAKFQKQENKMNKKERSLNFGVVGTGQAGSRLGAIFYSLGYETVVINTAIQDLKHIEVPESNKLLLEQEIGGCAKELSLGQAAAENHRDEIINLINSKLEDSQVNILCSSLGGGSGAGSCETLIDILCETGKPLVVICVLPMESEDILTKSNSLETLSKLAKMTQTKKISNLIVIDNSKLESIYHDVSQIDFYDIANKAIVEPIDTFNTLSAMTSQIKALDSMEWSKLLIDGEGLSIYGELTVDNYKEDTAIAEAVISNLSNNLLAEGFDLKESKYVGFVVVANKEVWSKIPSSSINYASAMVSDLCGNPKGIFKASYVINAPGNFVKVYSFFSGLSLPTVRIDELKKEVQESMKNVKVKDEQRNLNLQLDTGTNETVSAAQKIKDRIAQKSSAFGKLAGGKVVTDRRK